MKWTPKPDPISKFLLREILNQELTSPLNEMGLTKWNGDYLWFGEFNNQGIKKVFHYSLLKGESATFRWGVCFNFVQTYGMAKTLTNHKTDKSTRVHLWDEPEEYKNFGGKSFTKPFDKGMTTHWGEKECRMSIKKLFDANKSKMLEWYSKAQTIDDCIKVADYQIDAKGWFSGHSPNPLYVKAYLLAKIGKKEEAIEIITKIIEDYKKHWKPDGWDKMFEKVEIILSKL